MEAPRDDSLHVSGETRRHADSTGGRTGSGFPSVRAAVVGGWCPISCPAPSTRQRAGRTCAVRSRGGVGAVYGSPPTRRALVGSPTKTGTPFITALKASEQRAEPLEAGRHQRGEALDVLPVKRVDGPLQQLDVVSDIDYSASPTALSASDQVEYSRYAAISPSANS